jgi:transcriptional regulator with XRE-family HTH domain
MSNSEDYLNKFLRDNIGFYTSTELSQKSGLSQPNMSNWKKGKDIGIASLEKLAAAYDYKVSCKINMSFDNINTDDIHLTDEKINSFYDNL